LAILSALGASLMYAMASVLQQRSASAQPAEQSLRLGLLVRLLGNPIWVLGLCCDVAAYVLQFVALGHGTLVLVQPLLVCGLLFALPLGAAWAGRRLRTADWVAAAVVCAGLAVFLVVANPASGSSDASPLAWILLLGIDAVVATVLVSLTFGRQPRQRALLLSGAAGVLYGAAAALTKTSSHLLYQGWWRVVLHWQPYVLIVFGVGGMVLGQSAFQAGALDVSLPTMSVVDPIVSIVIGAVVFHETISSGPAAVLVQVIALVAMAWGVFALARSGSTSQAQRSPPTR
jgi:drug/metabolite transporter (DMT)-like permease